MGVEGGLPLLLSITAPNVDEWGGYLLGGAAIAETLDDDSDTTFTPMLIAPELGAVEKSVRGTQDGPNEGREGELETDTEADVDVEGTRRNR